MIEIICDACEKAFHVEDDQTGQKVPCPLCGDVNRVPEGAVERESPVREEPITDGGGEQEICVMRPAMFRAHPFRFLLILIMFLGGIVLYFYLGGREGKFLQFLRWPSLIAAGIGLVWWFIWWVATTLWIKAVITNKRTIRHEGIVRRHSTEVLHDHVRSVDINQNFTQRIFNVGYIGIDSAGQDGIEIEVRDIPRPYEIKRIIDQYRKM